MLCQNYLKLWDREITNAHGAAHETMLTSLQNILTREKCKEAEVLGHWHERMEGGKLRHDYAATQKSPKRRDRNEYDNFIEQARDFYQKHAKEAVGNLMKFISNLASNPPCMTYFYEAHKLEICFWIMLHLLYNQDNSLKMCITDFAPPEDICHQGDQNFENSDDWWHEMLPKEGDGLVDLAVIKLTASEEFSAEDEHHVFSVLAQRICLYPVLEIAETIKLVDQSVSHHMRLITGISADNMMFWASTMDVS
ncbi:uncharacterized protein EI90DRAFT_3013340 [Cantharellus anzutake]|uniref:uncharacterized protein n=1 Tax=Cantharellus anzutake TaxID=1750568 RepID=UPI001904CE4B|nr:uncharacterized protein EI90DRAFT_3013340 [Cantharellus anzutake]KAF8337992.1 hypothetical protein EI90DRAFT_3013340 [Cantharellus anzutake]